jgi:hypothetical protein
VCLAQTAFYYDKLLSQFVLDKQADEQKIIPSRHLLFQAPAIHSKANTYSNHCATSENCMAAKKKTWISASILNRMTSPVFPVSVKI